jgi:hypothetical protein
MGGAAQVRRGYNRYIPYNMRKEKAQWWGGGGGGEEGGRCFVCKERILSSVAGSSGTRQQKADRPSK